MNLISFPKALVDSTKLGPSASLSGLNLPNFIQSSGIVLETVAPSQLAYFLAARSLLPLIHELELPGTQNLGKGERHSKIAQQSSSSPCSVHGEYQKPPSDLFTFGPAKVSELRTILHHQFCYPEDTLLYLLQNGKIQRRKMIKTSEGTAEEPRTTEMERGSLDSSKIETTAQRAYLLLDVSQSMNGDRSPERKIPDRRGIIARGLGLAFVYEAKERETQVHFRPFSTAVGTRESARRPTEMASIAQEIIQISNSGSTALQSGLEAAAKDLSEIDEGARVDIMLITDGISHLTENPVAGKHLHTFLIGDSVPASSKGRGGVLDKLTAWSETFKRVWDGQFADFLTPRAEDILAFEALISDCASRIPYCTGMRELMQMMRIAELADEIARLSSNIGQNDKPDLSVLSAKTDALKKELLSNDLQKEILDRENAFKDLCDLYESNLPREFRTGASINTDPDLESLNNLDLSTMGKEGNSSVSFGLVFKALYRKVVNYLRKYF